MPPQILHQVHPLLLTPVEVEAPDTRAPLLNLLPPLAQRDLRYYHYVVGGAI